MRKKEFIKRKTDTSWQSVAKWYKNAVGDKGLYFHQKVIIPKSLELLSLSESSSVLDLACGQGIFSNYIPKNSSYMGFDLSEDLIHYARNSSRNKQYRFEVADISKNIKVKNKKFSHCIIILALQNIDNFAGVFKNAYEHLEDGGKFLIVINHPYFRIPRQSSWGIDNERKIQYRRIDRYLSPLKVPINMNPGKRTRSTAESKLTWSFHHSLQDYSSELQKNGFMINRIEEWASPRFSEGKAAKMENRAREEFPMFMAILCKKLPLM